MQDVARAVYRDSGAKQTPAIYGLLPEDFPLVAGNIGVPSGPAPKPDAEAWELIRNSTNPVDFDEFAKAFPRSDLAPAASLKAGSLRRATAGEPEPAGSGEQGRVNPKDGQRYVWIAPGIFPMGCSTGDYECNADEKPTRTTAIPKGFWMGQTPVTWAAWKNFRGAGPAVDLPSSDIPGRRLNGDDSLPVVAMTWSEAKTFCEWGGGRLPTEAEWEYAARAGTTGARYGNPDEIAWYGENSGKQRIDVAALLNTDAKSYTLKLFENGNGPKSVGLKKANAWGLFDMLGNVWQWTADWYSENYQESQGTPDLQGPVRGTLRSMRGGSWNESPWVVRVSSRNKTVPGNRSSIGFRCVMDN